MKKTAKQPTKEWLESQYVNCGMTCRQIADAIECHPRTIHSWLVKLGIPRRKSGWNIMPPEQKELRRAWGKAHREYIRQSLLGKGRTLESRRKQSKTMSGKNHWHWKGGITKYYIKLRQSFNYIQFRKYCFKRDNYKCRICGNGGNIHLHHIIPVSENILLFQSEDNAITVCESCHEHIHNKKIRVSRRHNATVTSS